MAEKKWTEKSGLSETVFLQTYLKEKLPEGKNIRSVKNYRLAIVKDEIKQKSHMREIYRGEPVFLTLYTLPR